MFRTISFLRNPLRSVPQTLYSITQPSLFLNSYQLQLKLPRNPSSIPPNLQFSPISILFSPFSQTSLLQKKDDAYNDESLFNRDPTTPPKLFVVQPRLRPDTLLRAKLDEALNLANSLEEQRDGFYDTELCEKGLPPHLVVQNPAVRSSKSRSVTYFGPGTVDTVKCHLNAVESKGEVDAVYVNTILSGVQQRNLERAWGKPVLDRIGLIIEIFNAHAQTKEAKLQAELAALMYKRTRLVRVRSPDGRYTFGATGESEVVSARGRGSGGRGSMSGAGETELKLQRQRILERRSHLLSQIEDVRRTRAVQRAARKRSGGSNGQGLATVAVVGYTNAGKSTLVGALSESDLFSDDRLFATVDPRLRSVILPSGRKALLSDTVGFISDLPVQLVEAFHATLEEVVEADLLVHVIDSSAPYLDDQRSAVLQVLQQIGVSEEKLHNMIEVWNKIDLQEGEMDAEKYLDYGEDGAANSLSGAEDDDDDSLSPVVADDDKIVSELSSDDVQETMDDHEGDYSDGWLSAGGEESEDDPGSPHRWKSLDNQQSGPFDDRRMTKKDSCSQPQCIPHVKTSAMTGVGLQELLELIDEKLETQMVVERNSFDRKWRPPRNEDSGTAVEL